MNKILAYSLTVMTMLAVAASGYAENEPRDLSREKMLFRNYSGEGSTSVSSLCLEGYVFVLVNGNTSNQTFITQVYEERNGRVVPKRCE